MKNKPVVQTAMNFKELLERVDGDRELLCELLGIFKQEFPRLFQELSHAMALTDTSRVAMISHGIKGMLANLAIQNGADLAAGLEKLARSGDKSSLRKAFATFELEARNFLPQVEAYWAELRS